jgi:Tfp pilus assembly protein PilX
MRLDKNQVWVEAKTTTDRQRRGSTVVFMLVILSVITVGLVMTLAVTGGVQTQVASLTLKRNQAFYAAEAGIQNAFWHMENDSTWRADATTPLTGTVGNCTYTVTAVGGWNSPVLIQSQGVYGSDAVSKISATITPDTIVPAISVGNNFANNGNVVINGDVQAKGSIDTSGKIVVNGGLQAGGTITTTGSVDITGGSAQNVPNITVPSINVNALISAATQVIHTGGSTPDVKSIDFGQGGIVYFDGPINLKGNVTISGYGTLVVNGDISIQSSASFGSSSSPALANVVLTGSLTIDGYLGIVGSIYAGTDISKKGGLGLTGVLVAQHNLTTSGGITLTRAQPPAFDPRSAISGTNTMAMKSFTGPIF